MLKRVTNSSGPTVGLYFVSGARKSYNIAKTLSLAGCRVVVRIEESEADLLDPAHSAHVDRQYCALLYGDAGIEIVTHVSAAPPVDALLYEMSRQPLRYPDELRAWVRRAPKVAAWNSSWHEGSARANLRSELDIVGKYFPFIPRTRAVVLHNGRIRLRPTALFTRPYVQGGFVHPLFLAKPELRKTMFDAVWRPDERRGIRLIFAGDAGSPRRRTIVPQIERYLEGKPHTDLIRTYAEPLASAKPDDGRQAVLWLPILPGERQQIPVSGWGPILRNSDFCFCPPGYEQKSHRVIESLVSGSIPIVHCPEDYDIDMQDGVNCLLVHRGDWQTAVARAMDCGEADIVRMREGVARLVEEHLTHRASANRWLRFMGLERLPAAAASGS